MFLLLPSRRCRGKAAQHKSIINPDWDFQKMGIGGLDDEFSAIFRRAFASRVFPPEVVQQLGHKHVRGILLYGPPGKPFFSFFLFFRFFFVFFRFCFSFFFSFFCFFFVMINVYSPMTLHFFSLTFFSLKIHINATR